MYQKIIDLIQIVRIVGGKSNRWATWNIVSSKNIFQSCNNRLLKIMSNLNGEWGEYNKHESILCKWI